jgi:hypothetical protein
MPYRRLPNTDQARLRTLRAILEASSKQNGDSVVSYKSQLEAKTCLQNFEQLIFLYQQMYESQITSNKNFQNVFQNARLYLSHFIQVLNMSIIRGEIKPEMKQLYHLPKDTTAIPDFSSADVLVKVGMNIVEGEAERIRLGGTPLYNPTIAKVKVYYDLFKEHRLNQLSLQRNTQRYATQVNAMRASVDDLIVKLWDQVEFHFFPLPPFQRIESCKAWGVIYYYRKGEAQLTPEDDISKPHADDFSRSNSKGRKVQDDPINKAELSGSNHENVLFEEQTQNELHHLPTKMTSKAHRKNKDVSAQQSLLSLCFQ